jgi:hypothetical protein
MLRGNTGSSLGQLQQCGGEKKGLTLGTPNKVGVCVSRHIVVSVLS